MIRTGSKRDWILAAIACAAMLVLPALTWFLIPKPAIFALPLAVDRATTTTGTTTSDVERPRDPAEVHARGRRSADERPARGEAAEATDPVRGVVLDPDGRRAAGASVTCADKEPPLTAATDEDGNFELPASAAGCKAIARHPQLFPSDETTLTSGSANTLRLPRGGGIEGQVVDERGSPITSYMLSVESYQGPAADRAPTRQMRTIQDGRGAFSWDKIPAGRYILTVSADARPPVRSATIEVESARTTSNVRITLARGATLTGHVLDAATRKPIAGATVALDALTTTGAQGVAPATTDDQGAYSLDGAPAGPFSVRVTHQGYRARTMTGLTTRGSVSLRQDVELTPIPDGGSGGEDYAGIGAYLEASPTGVRFGRLVPSGPAEAAGVAAGDVIRRIDGTDASALAVVDCMQSLRGPEGSRVTVQVERAGQLVELTIQRRALSL